MTGITTRLSREAGRAAFQARVEDPRLGDVLVKMGFARIGENLERTFTDSGRMPDIFANLSSQLDEMVRHQTGESAPLWDVALRVVCERLEGRVDWWLSGSAALAVRGIDVVRRDLDLVVGDPHLAGEAFADILVEPVREMSGWIARWHGRAFQGALIEWLADVDPQIDSSGPHEQGPLAEGALEDLVWEGYRTGVLLSASSSPWLSDEASSRTLSASCGSSSSLVRTEVPQSSYKRSEPRSRWSAPSRVLAC